MNSNLTLDQFASKIRTSLPEQVAKQFARDFFDAIAYGLVRDQKVSVNGLGTFVVSSFEAGEILFMPDPQLAATVNEPFAMFEAVAIPDDDNFSFDVHEEEEAEAEVPAPVPTPAAPTVEMPAQTPAKAPVEAPIKTPVPTPPPSPVPTPVTPPKPIQEPIREPDPKPMSETVETTNNDSNPIAHAEIVEVHKPDITLTILLCTLSLCIGLVAGYFLAPKFAGGDDEDEADDTDATSIEMVETAQSDEITTNETPLLTADITEPAATDQPVSAEQPIQTAAEPVTDTVSSRRFLTTMAQDHYGSKHFWVYIYLENRDKLGHPDKISAGTVVTIPPASKYNIDKNNPESRRDAEQKAREIYSLYK